MTYRVMGTNGIREKRVAEGLTLEAATAMRMRMERDPLVRGFAIVIEAEDAAADAILNDMRKLHAGGAR